MLELPIKFENEMKALFASEYDDFIQAINKEYKKSIRFNPKKLFAFNTEVKLKKLESIMGFNFSSSKVAWDKYAYYVDNDVNLSSHPYYNAGLFYFQEASAMAPVNFIPLKEGMKVLDLCAAPGGKTLQISCMIGDKGVLLSNDISVSRQRASLRNIERFGLKNVFVSAESPEKIAKNYSNYFDAILVDAPCSGEGMFAKDKKTLLNWNEDSNELYAKKQLEILNTIKPALKTGGYIMYSTCTFSAKENEEVIKSFLTYNDDIELVDIESSLFTEGYSSMGYTKRILPHKHDGLGHFMALIKKKDVEISREDNNSKLINFTKEKKLANDLKNAIDIFIEFSRTLQIDLMSVLGIDISDAPNYSKFRLYSNKLYYITDLKIPEKSFRILRNGLLLGEIKHNKFIPSQAFAMTIPYSAITKKINFDSDDIKIYKYLKGEGLAIIQDKGYILLYVDELPLAWALSDGKKLKNKLKRDWIV